MNYEDYYDAFIRKVESGTFNLLFAVKSFDKSEPFYESQTQEVLFSFIFAYIETLTPRELMQLFPVKKIFNGEKFGEKDYYYTMKMIRDYGIDNKIKNAFNFLWDYENDDIRNFLICYMKYLSREYRANTGRPMATDGMEAAHIPYMAYSPDFMWCTGCDGKETKVTMPNVALWV